MNRPLRGTKIWIVATAIFITGGGAFPILDGPPKYKKIQISTHRYESQHPTHCSGVSFLRRRVVKSNQLKLSEIEKSCNGLERARTQRIAIHNYEAVPSNLSDAVRYFFFSKKGVGPSLVVVSIAFFLNTLFTLHTPLSTIDVITGMIAIVFWWFQEHWMHGNLLHSNFNWIGSKIHRDHHNKPYFHISIDPPALLLGWLFSVHLFLRMALPLHVALSATIGYATAGLFYEWTHFVVHTKVKPRRIFFQKLRDHHIRHHLVNEKYWLGFSMPLVDDLFGTNPSVSEARAMVAAKASERICEK